MFQIQRITADPLQQQTLVLSDGRPLFIEMYYRPNQQGWFFNTIQFETFELHGTRIVNSPNMLHQYRKQLPFGLACFSDGNREPQLQQDFSSGASKLYILTAEEVLEYVEYLSK